MLEEWNHKIFNVQKPGFEALALEVFAFQYRHNAVYRAYTDALGVRPAHVRALSHIPFLPIRFFKSHPVKTTDFEPEAVFESSGTTGSINSRHYVKDLSLYEESFLKTFSLFYGDITNYTIFALLPSYLERTGSSLVYMVDRLIRLSKKGDSRFYLADAEKMMETIAMREKQLRTNENEGQKNLLIGVTYALLDIMPAKNRHWQHTLVMETGGMKGRKKEMVRPEVHELLCRSFGVSAIHAEYGMTELLSQAYSRGNGIFNSPPWMKVLLRDEEDPLQLKETGGGLINIIDLANIYSCAFIATDDVGRLHANGSFEVLGRMDGSDVRGCSLMVV
jgi:Acyl-protein synthetase, LuxE